MDGITILSQHSITHNQMVPGLGKMTIIAVIIGVLLSFLVWWLSEKSNITRKWIRCTLSGLVLALFLFVGIARGGTKEVLDYTTYDIIVADSVGFNEFNDTFTILEVNGNIYTVRVNLGASFSAYRSSQ